MLELGPGSLGIGGNPIGNRSKGAAVVNRTIHDGAITFSIVGAPDAFGQVRVRVSVQPPGDGPFFLGSLTVSVAGKTVTNPLSSIGGSVTVLASPQQAITATAGQVTEPLGIGRNDTDSVDEEKPITQQELGLGGYPNPSFPGSNQISPSSTINTAKVTVVDQNGLVSLKKP